MSSGATLALFARLIVSLSVVFGLMWFLARVVRRRGIGGVGGGGQNRRPGVQVDIVARRTLSRNASIAVVRAGNQHMVVGVTDHMITKLGDADPAELEIENMEGQWTAPSPGPTTGPAPSWKAMLDQLRDRTVRT
jgi:flagellar biogenesis protein FliO